VRRFRNGCFLSSIKSQTAFQLVQVRFVRENKETAPASPTCSSFAGMRRNAIQNLTTRVLEGKRSMSASSGFLRARSHDIISAS
jgi:hypothetical protein